MQIGARGDAIRAGVLRDAVTRDTAVRRRLTNLITCSSSPLAAPCFITALHSGDQSNLMTTIMRIYYDSANLFIVFFRRQKA